MGEVALAVDKAGGGVYKLLLSWPLDLKLFMVSNPIHNNVFPIVDPRSTSSAAVDVSIILNVHREAPFLPRTLTSLDEAARYARGFGIRCELVVVEDRPDQATRELFRRRDFSAYVRHIVIEVDNGSLGLSRNDGIAVARGRFVMTADADDLVSFNIIVENLHAAAACADGARILFFPQYYFAFGAGPHLYEMFGLDVTTPQALVGYHPYVSRFFARRDHLAALKFLDLRLSAGFAYEDWHFNLEAVAAGFDLRVVPDTIVFYRRRPDSLLCLADNLSTGVTAYASLFDPPIFLKRGGQWLATAKAPPDAEKVDGYAVRQRFSDNRVCRELTKAAARFEPAIDPVGLFQLPTFSNINGARAVGVAYHAICQLICDLTFDEILLVPFLSSGGGEKFVLHVILALLEQNPGTRLLIISGEPFAEHAWLDRLPPNALFLDLYAIAAGLDERQRQILTLRTIQASGRNARIHIKTCPYAVEFLRKFASVLDENEIVYYRFCDNYERFYESWAPRGYEFGFISDCGHYFQKIITDNDRIRRSDIGLLPHLADKYTTLYNYVEDDIRRPAPTTEIRGRVLWASRMDAQKRPALLPLIAAELERLLPGVVIDVFGSPVMESFDLAQLEGRENLAYRGPFHSFASLRPEQFDLFLYTSAFDGLPNVVLEAMASGLVVIATDVGGVSEAVDEQTGVLVDGALPDDQLAHACAAAIVSCYEDPERVKRLRAGALERIAERHSKRRHSEAVQKLFRRAPSRIEDDAMGNLGARASV